MAESIADKLKKAWKHITTDSNELAKELRRLNPNYMYQSGSKKTALVKRAKDNIKKNKASDAKDKKIAGDPKFLEGRASTTKPVVKKKVIKKTPRFIRGNWAKVPRKKKTMTKAELNQFKQAKVKPTTKRS